MLRPSLVFLFGSFAVLCAQEPGIPPEKPNAEQIKRQFAGKGEVDKSTGRVTLIYSFSKKDQLDDFETSETPIRLPKGGGIQIPVGTILRHKAKWDEVKITTTLLPLNQQGILIGTTDNIHVALGKPTTTTNKVLIQDSGKNISQQTYKLKDFSRKLIPIEWALDSQKSSLHFGGVHLGSAFSEAKEASRQIEFHADKGDMTVGAIRLVGKLNPDWWKKEIQKQEKSGSEKKNSSNRK